MASLKDALAVNKSEASDTVAGIRARGAAVKEYNDSVGGTAPAPVAPAPAGPASPKDKIAPGAKYGDRGKEQRIDVRQMVKPLGSFKRGGKVKKTGIYQLHKGEQVVPKKKVGALAKALSK